MKQVLLFVGAAVAGIFVIGIVLMSLGGPRIFPLVEGQMPMQLIIELTLSVGAFAILSYVAGKFGFPIPRFWQGILFWAFILLYLKYRIYPPIPFSVRAMYGTVALVGVFLWMSGNEEDWKNLGVPGSFRWSKGKCRCS